VREVPVYNVLIMMLRIGEIHLGVLGSRNLESGVLAVFRAFLFAKMEVTSRSLSRAVF
jgi:hypothetical protein